MRPGEFHPRSRVDAGTASAVLPLEWESPVPVLVVEDHPLMVLAIGEALAAEDWIEVVASAGSAEGAVAAAEMANPNVVILDLRLKGPASQGILLAGQMLERFPSLRIVVYSAYVSNALVQELARVGVLGYVSKTEPTDVLVQAIAAVSRGHAFYSSEVRALAEASRTRYDETASGITAREAEVIQLIADGKTNPEIAETLSVSVSTVIGAVMSAMDKLEAHNRADLVMRAVRARLIVTEE